MSPSASETSSSESRTFSETPSSETMERAWDASESDTSESMETDRTALKWHGTGARSARDRRRPRRSRARGRRVRAAPRRRSCRSGRCSSTGCRGRSRSGRSTPSAPTTRSCWSSARCRAARHRHRVGVLAMRGARSRLRCAHVRDRRPRRVGGADPPRADPRQAAADDRRHGVSIAVLWYLAPRPNRAADDRRRDGGSARAQPMGVDRRRFVGGAIGIGSVAVIAGGVGRVLQQRFEVEQRAHDIELPAVDSPSADVLPADAQSPSTGCDRSSPRTPTSTASTRRWSCRRCRRTRGD
jgi:hypothetical protein